MIRFVKAARRHTNDVRVSTRWLSLARRTHQNIMPDSTKQANRDNKEAERADTVHEIPAFQLPPMYISHNDYYSMETKKLNAKRLS